MTTSVQTPFNDYVGNGSVKIFSYTFQIGEAADLYVYKDGVLQGAGYSITGAGNLAGGNVTFVTAPATNVIVLLKRVTSLNRSTDYTEGAALPSSTLDADIDRVVRQIQDLDAGFVRYNLNDLNVDFNGSRITGAGNPVNNQDYTTKSYVDSSAIAVVSAVAANAAASLTSANNSTSSATASHVARIAAEVARDQALLALDSFDDRYLGPKAIEPTLDNDGNPLVGGALYYNTTEPAMKLYTGTIWVAAYVAGDALLELDNRKANLASPTFTGTPLAPTVSASDDSTKLATTAFVKNQNYIASGQGAFASGATVEIGRYVDFHGGNAGETDYDVRFDVAGNGALGGGNLNITAGSVTLNNGPLSFPVGTRMSFNQTAAPTGWTKDTTAALNDSIIRIVTGIVSSGGSTAFSTFNGQLSVGATTLSITQIPSHSHVQNAHNHIQDSHNHSQNAHNHTATGGLTQTGGGNGFSFGANTAQGAVSVASTTATNIAATATNQAATATNQNTGGDGSHTHTITTAIKYNDFIIASKN